VYLSKYSTALVPFEKGINISLVVMAAAMFRADDTARILSALFMFPSLT
jgi:hypothetical protein